MDATCKPIPLLGLNQYEAPQMLTDCSQDPTGRKLYDEVAPKVVTVETGNTLSPRPQADSKVGTGFFVGSGDEIVTNAHVALSGQYVDIITSDNKMYPAEVIKIDDTNDLALLKVQGLSPEPSRAVDTSTTATGLNSDSVLRAFGHPGGYDDVVMSEGNFIKNSKLADIIDPNAYPDMKPILQDAQSSDPELANDANLYLNSNREVARMKIYGGNSGSIVVDQNGHLAGVIADRVDQAKALVIPPTAVTNLLERPETKFSFNYAPDTRMVSMNRTDGDQSPPVVIDLSVPVGAPTGQTQKKEIPK